jgi:hypothetical protein
MADPVDLPAGRSVLALDFRTDGWDWLGHDSSLGTAGVLAWTAAHHRRTG